MPKLQRVRSKGDIDTGRVFLNLPKEHTDLLGWVASDTVIVTSDKESNSIIITKV